MRAFLYCLAVAWALGFGAAQAQDKTTVVVKVADQNGAVIAHANVLAVSSDGARNQTLMTDEQGTATLSDQPGTYKLTVTAPGFVSEQKQVVLAEMKDADSGGKSETEYVMLRIDPREAMADDAGPKSAKPTAQNSELISPARPIPEGKAPRMQVKLISDNGEKVYSVIFYKGDEVLSGLTDFCRQYKVQAAHLTAIGAVSSATVGWLDLQKKMYRAIHVNEQVEVLSMMGDVATYNDKPVVHAHLVMGKHDGSTVGGHLWEAHVNPTLEVFVSVDPTPLKKRADDESGMKVIDPKQ